MLIDRTFPLIHVSVHGAHPRNNQVSFHLSINIEPPGNGRRTGKQKSLKFLVTILKLHIMIIVAICLQRAVYPPISVQQNGRAIAQADMNPGNIHV